MKKFLSAILTAAMIACMVSVCAVTASAAYESETLVFDERQYGAISDHYCVNVDYYDEYGWGVNNSNSIEVLLKDETATDYYIKAISAEIVSGAALYDSIQLSDGEMRAGETYYDGCTVHIDNIDGTSIVLEGSDDDFVYFGSITVYYEDKAPAPAGWVWKTARKLISARVCMI